jgi:hypothetical protein
MPRKTTIQTIRGASYNPADEPKCRLRPLAAQLRSDQSTLNGMRAQVAAVEHAKPSQRAKLLDGVPLRQLLQGLNDIQSIVATEKARIAYLQTHPGTLPPE